MTEERSVTARAAAEQALIRVVTAYGATPEFVVLGGLGPALLCSGSPRTHAGTTDIDVQVNLEISVSASNAGRLEQALLQAGFTPTIARIWRWEAPVTTPSAPGQPPGRGTRGAVVKFELLADLDDYPEAADVVFDGADRLGAINLRGTGPAVEDVQIRDLVSSPSTSEVGALATVQVRVTGLAGFLLAKVAAAQSRRAQKDWYDIAFVLLHNDLGGPDEAITAVLDRFGPSTGSRHLLALRSALLDLAANFAVDEAQGPTAYATQLLADHPEVDPAVAATDAQLAVSLFCVALLDT